MVVLSVVIIAIFFQQKSFANQLSLETCSLQCGGQTLVTANLSGRLLGLLAEIGSSGSNGNGNDFAITR